MRRRLARFPWLALALSGSLAAAELQPYTVRIAATGDSGRDRVLRDVSVLLQLQDADPVSPMALLARARSDRERMYAVLRSEGFFDGKVVLRADGHDIDDPGAAAAIEARPATPPVEITAEVTPGPLYTFGSITALDAQGAPLPADEAAALKLAVGEPARGADILAAEGRVLSAMQDDGHAFAKVAERTLTVDHARRTMTVVLRFEPGPAVRIGPIAVDGLKRLDRDFAEARVARFRGRPYSPDEVEKARLALLDLGVFAAVRARLAPQPTPGDTVPVTMETVELLPRRVEFGGAYATSEGGSLRASWLHRDLFGHAERLQLTAEVSSLMERGPQDYGYRLAATFTRPDFLAVNQSLRLDAAGMREFTDAYERVAALAGASLERKLSDRLTVSLGLSFERSAIKQGDVTTRYTLIGIPASAVWEDADDPLDSTRGTRGRLDITPYPAALGSSLSFTTLRATGSAYHDFSDAGRSVLAGRLVAGLAAGASRDALPADRRVYAGGSGSIRGFPFQGVGPRVGDQPLGGTTMLALNLEYRQRIGESWGAVGFVDAGGLGTGRAPDWPDDLAVGAGLGVRYYTPIGPIRADVAVPVSGRQHGDQMWQLYIGIGQAF